MVSEQVVKLDEDASRELREVLKCQTFAELFNGLVNQIVPLTIGDNHDIEMKRLQIAHQTGGKH